MLHVSPLSPDLVCAIFESGTFMLYACHYSGTYGEGHGCASGRRQECRRGTQECAMPLSFPNSAHLHKWWGGRPRPHPAPWPACRWWQAPDSSREERDEGVPRGPGGPPSNYAESPALRKLSGIAHECVRHLVSPFRYFAQIVGAGLPAAAFQAASSG